MTKDEDIEKIRKRLFSILVGYEVGSYKDNIDQFYKELCDVYKELYELTMIKSDRCVKCDTEVPEGCVYCQSCIDEIREDLDLIDEAEEWVKNQVWGDDDGFIQLRDAYVAGAKKYKR